MKLKLTDNDRGVLVQLVADNDQLIEGMTMAIGFSISELKAARNSEIIISLKAK